MRSRGRALGIFVVLYLAAFLLAWVASAAPWIFIVAVGAIVFYILGKDWRREL